jgi:hypothetical protein
MRLVSKLLPRQWRRLLKSSELLSEAYGHRLSIKQNRCVDRLGNPIPWYTYPAIEYLQGLDFSTSQVLEFGSGASSLWWARRAKSVLSVEHDATWFSKVKQNQPANLTIKLEETADQYVIAGSNTDTRYDVIVIDGVHRHRCAQAIGSLIADSHLIVLDNSDWHPLTAQFLREELNLLQVDFHGFGPINNYTWTTSVLFSRNYQITPAQGRLPIYSAGAIHQVAEGQQADEQAKTS